MSSSQWRATSIKSMMLLIYISIENILKALLLHHDRSIFLSKAPIESVSLVEPSVLTGINIGQVERESAKILSYCYADKPYNNNRATWLSFLIYLFHRIIKNTSNKIFHKVLFNHIIHWGHLLETQKWSIIDSFWISYETFIQTFMQWIQIR